MKPEHQQVGSSESFNHYSN